jgi:CspA family cold shock protein
VSKIVVDLVRYDTNKTTKRKRSNLLVDSKNEEAVIEKLEKIHKGDAVKTIHEIVWGEEIVDNKKENPLYTGEVKFFDKKKGFGFISPDDDGLEDLFFHSSALGGVDVYDRDIVDFEISEGPKGPVAVKIEVIEDED